jgi:hypothetical protein
MHERHLSLDTLRWHLCCLPWRCCRATAEKGSTLTSNAWRNASLRDWSSPVRHNQILPSVEAISITGDLSLSCVITS